MEVVGDEQLAPLKCIQQRHRPTLADKWCRAIHFDHGQPPPGGCNRVAFSCVRLLSNPECVQFGLEGAPINYRRCSGFVSHGVFTCLLLCDVPPDLEPPRSAR